MTHDPKKNAADQDAEASAKGPGRPVAPRPEGDAEVRGPDDAKSGSGSEGGAGDDIEILEVIAADEAGVPLEDDDEVSIIEDEEVTIVDDDADEEFEVDSGDFGMPPRKGRASEAPSALLSAELSTARAQVQELREQILRTTADFDNFRKRVDRDRIEERKQATAGLARNVLPVLDSFRWALVSAQKGEDAAVKGFAEGFRLIEAQLLDVLKAAGLEAVDATGIFDPSVHEALMQEASSTVPHMTVLEVFEPGWRLGGRLLRPARVKVANNPSNPSTPPRESDEGSPSETESATTH